MNKKWFQQCFNNNAVNQVTLCGMCLEVNNKFLKWSEHFVICPSYNSKQAELFAVYCRKKDCLSFFYLFPLKFLIVYRPNTLLFIYHQQTYASVICYTKIILFRRICCMICFHLISLERLRLSFLIRIYVIEKTIWADL